MEWYTAPMKIDLIYGTNSSGTAMVAEIIAEALRTGKHQMTVRHARDVSAVTIGRAPLTILGSCTWERIVGGKKLEGQLQYHMFRLATSLRKRRLTDYQFALFALGDSSYSLFCHAADELEQLVVDIGAQQIVPTLRIDGWFFNQPANEQRVRRWAEHLKSTIV